MTQKLALQWLPCQAPGVIGSALGLVGPVSVYCGSATSISVCRSVPEIHSHVAGTLSNQPTNNNPNKQVNGASVSGTHCQKLLAGGVVLEREDSEGRVVKTAHIGHLHHRLTTQAGEVVHHHHCNHGKDE